MSRLYWVGLYEKQGSTKWKWFFQVDLAPKIGYVIKRVVGEGKHTLPSYHSVVVTAVLTRRRTYSHMAAVLLRWPDSRLLVG
jgi:hypothetical protein